MFRFDCFKSKDEYTQKGYNLVENPNGTVSLFTPEGVNYTSLLMNKSCCEAIGYTFDIENQNCLWKSLDGASEDEGFKIILNPEGNNGALFGVDDNETCCLDISFDYMFKFDCSDLINATTDTTVVTSGGNEEEISKLKDALNQNNQLIEQYQNLINTYNEVPYVIECRENGDISATIDSGTSLYDGRNSSSAYMNTGTINKSNQSTRRGSTSSSNSNNGNINLPGY